MVPHSHMLTCLNVCGIRKSTYGDNFEIRLVAGGMPNFFVPFYIESVTGYHFKNYMNDSVLI